MFGTIRKHQTWLWAIIITLTIISFVIFFSPYSKMNDRQGRANYGSINGEKVSQEAYAKAYNEVHLRYFMLSGRWPDQDAQRTGFDPMRETYQWLLLVQKLDKLDIHASMDAVAQTARAMIQPFQRMGVKTPQEFFQQVLAPKGIGPEDFQRFVQHYLGIQELISTFGVGGKLVTQKEVESLYQREHQEISTEAVVFSASNYLAAVKVTPETIAQYYSNNLAAYRIPDRVQVSYVKWPVSNYLAAAEAELVKTNFEAIIEANFQKLGTNYFPDAKTPEATKAKIREELIRSRALLDARKLAYDFAGPLFDMNPLRAENLELVAKTNGLKVVLSAPFEREAAPAELNVGPDFTKQAFARTADDPFAGPLVGEDGVYVIALAKKIPSEIPALDTIRDRVTSDYKFAQAAQLARQAGTIFRSSLTNALAQGKTFAAAVTEAGQKPVVLPPLSLSTRSLDSDIEQQVGLNQIKQLAFGTAPGKISEFQPTMAGGIILFVRAKLPLDESKMRADLPNFVTYVRQSRQQEAFNDWFRKEAEKGLRDTPVFQTKPPVMSPGAAKS